MPRCLEGAANRRVHRLEGAGAEVDEDRQDDDDEAAPALGGGAVHGLDGRHVVAVERLLLLRRDRSARGSSRCGRRVWPASRPTKSEQLRTADRPARALPGHRHVAGREVDQIVQVQAEEDEIVRLPGRAPPDSCAG